MNRLARRCLARLVNWRAAPTKFFGQGAAALNVNKGMKQNMNFRQETMIGDVEIRE